MTRLARGLGCLLALAPVGCDSDPAATTNGGTGGADTGASTTVDDESGDESADSTGTTDGGTSGGARVVDIDKRARYVLAVTDEGTLYAWGEVPGAGAQDVPLLIDAVDDVVSVSTGGQDTFLLQADGTAARFEGTAAPTPVELEGITDIDAGDEGANCAIAGADSQLYCWGFSAFGVLGFDPPENPETPTMVPGMTEVAKVSVGAEHTCALMESGVVRCTGRGGEGQLGDGAFDSSRASFEDVPGISDFVTIESSLDSTCGLRSSGEVLCWGWTWLTGGVGTPTAPVPGIPTAAGMFSNDKIQCAWDAAGVLSCWGFGPNGGVGNGETWIDMAQEEPFTVPGLPPVEGGAAGTCVVTNEGEVYCWGENSYGQTGTGLPDSTVLEPTLVQF